MNQKIYWRLKVDVKDGSVAWEKGWIAGHPAKGLIEIADTPTGYTGKVLSETEIEYKKATA